MPRWPYEHEDEPDGLTDELFGYPETPIPGGGSDYNDPTPWKPKPPAETPEEDLPDDTLTPVPGDEPGDVLVDPEIGIIDPELGLPGVIAFPPIRGPATPAPHPGAIIAATVIAILASKLPKGRMEEIIDAVVIAVEAQVDAYVDGEGNVVYGAPPSVTPMIFEGVRVILEQTRNGEIVVNAEPAEDWPEEEQPWTPAEPIPDLPAEPTEPINPGKEPANDPPEPPTKVPPPPETDVPDEHEEQPDEIVIPLPLPERDPSSDPEPFPDTWFPPMAPDPGPMGPEEWDYPEAEPDFFPRENPDIYTRPWEIPGVIPQGPFQLPEWHPDYDPEDWWYIPYSVEIEWVEGIPQVVIKTFPKRKEKRREEPETTKPTPAEEGLPETTPQTESPAAPDTQAAPSSSPGQQPSPQGKPSPAQTQGSPGSIATRVLGNIFGPFGNPMIAVQVGFTFFPGRGPRGGQPGRSRIRTEIKRDPEPSRERIRHREEQKQKHQQKYLALLMFINKWYGPVSEAMDFIKILKENITIDGKSVSKYESFDTIFEQMYNAENVEFDFDSFLIDVYEEALTDALIGALSHAEKEWLLRTFGRENPILNSWGNPSTQLTRLQKALGQDPVGPVTEMVDQAKLEIDRLNKLREKRDEFLEKLENGIPQTP